MFNGLRVSALGFGFWAIAVGPERSPSTSKKTKRRIITDPQFITIPFR